MQILFRLSNYTGNDDFSAHAQTTLASLALIADQLDLLSADLLMNGLRMRFKGDQLTDALELIERSASIDVQRLP